MALGFGADCIKIVVSMATDRSHRLTMGKTTQIVPAMPGNAPGVDSFRRLKIGKTKKIFFSETTRPGATIFCM